MNLKRLLVEELRNLCIKITETTQLLEIYDDKALKRRASMSLMNNCQVTEKPTTCTRGVRSADSSIASAVPRPRERVLQRLDRYATAEVPRFRSPTDLRSARQFFAQTPNPTDTVILPADQTIQGIRFPMGTKVHFDKNGKLESAYLPTVRTILGVRSRDVEFFENGKLKVADISSNQTIQSVRVDRGFVSFYENGKLMTAFLAADQTIQGIQWAMDSRLDFHENGKVGAGTLSTDQNFRGIPLRGLSEVNFYETGQLSKATLAADYTAHGTTFTAGSTIALTPQGIVYRATLGANQKVGGIPLSRHTVVDFYDDGRFADATLGHGQMIQGIPFPKGTRVSFDRYGKVAAKLGGDHVFHGVQFSKGDELWFYQDGKVRKVRAGGAKKVQGIPISGGMLYTLRSNGSLQEIWNSPVELRIQGLLLAKNTVAEFHDNGKLKSGIITKEQVIAGKRYPKGTKVEFNRSGNLLTRP